MLLLNTVSILILFTISNVSSYNYETQLTEFREKFSNIREKLSSKCSLELEYVFQDRLTLFQQIVFDASSKIPDGLMNGRTVQMGDYDSCMATRLKTVDKTTIFGKYCLGFLSLVSNSSSKLFKDTYDQLQGEFKISAGRQNKIYSAICVPSGCTEDDIHLIMPSFTYSKQLCYSDDNKPNLDTGAIVAIVIVSIFIAVAVISTIYDCYLYYSEKKAADEIYLAFSFLTNGKKLFNHSKNPDQLLCLNGIRVISIMWVIHGHTFLNKVAGNVALANLKTVLEYRERPDIMYVMGSTVSVDSFFLMGGLVTVYTYLKAVDKNIKFNLPMYYIHRYLRLTPAYAAMILIQTNLITYIAEGPMWGLVSTESVGDCKKTWWKSLLYIQNYFNDTYSCVGQSWYLYADMQLFVLSPLLLLPLKKWKKYTLIAMGMLSVVGVIIPFVLSLEFNLNAFMGGTKEPVNYFIRDLYYKQTYARFGPYVLGMLFGYYIYKLRKGETKLRLSRIQVLFAWLITLTVIVVCIYGGHSAMVSKTYERWSHAFYLGLNRSAWAIGVGMMITLCVTGYGGFIDTFLSLPVFQFLAKISYSMYLTHYFIIICIDASRKTLIYISHMELIINFWSVFIPAVGASIILSLLFESPVLIIEKKLFGGIGKKKREGVSA